MFTAWQNLYQMAGEAAATLIGLLFIVMSLTSGREASARHERGMRLFTTPTVFHLVSVLVISALTLVPDGENSRVVLMLGWAGLGLVYMAGLTVQLGRIDDPTHWSDFWWYGVAPVILYLALAAATSCAWAELPHAAYFVALCLIALLLVTIRNAWDLVTWLAPRRE